MATFNGFLRSVNAMSRQIERDNRRTTREHERYLKILEKQQSIEDARDAVVKWCGYLLELISLHKTVDCFVDWEEIKCRFPPTKPEYSAQKEYRAKIEYANYKPSLIDKLFRRVEKRTQILLNAIAIATDEDEREYQRLLSRYSSEQSKLEKLQEIAVGVESFNLEAFKSALDLLDVFSPIEKYGSSISYSFFDEILDIDVFVQQDDIIPDYELKLTSTGKLSKKGMAKGKFNELYQDHICSLILRISREVFACIPIEKIRINALCDMVNPTTGHLEETPILSVIIPKRTIDNVNLDAIDPSECMKNFVCNMSFKKISGFNPVNRAELIG